MKSFSAISWVFSSLHSSNLEGSLEGQTEFAEELHSLDDCNAADWKGDVDCKGDNDDCQDDVDNCKCDADDCKDVAEDDGKHDDDDGPDWKDLLWMR